jgi:error-prone DNA polymerase
MGFWSPATILADARRHGVEVRGPDINASADVATLEPCPSSAGEVAVRVGLSYVRTIGAATAALIAAGRPYADMADVVRRAGLTQVQMEALATAGAFGCFPASAARSSPLLQPEATSPQSPQSGPPLSPQSGPPLSPQSGPPLSPKSGPPQSPKSPRIQREAPFSTLSVSKTAPECENGANVRADEGAEEGVSQGDRRLLERREALWAAGAVAQSGPDRLPGVVVGADPPALAPMTAIEKTVADFWATGLSAEHHPVEFARPGLAARGVLTAAELQMAEPGTRVRVAGLVTHRQRPATAGGTTFVNLEDETGLINVICSRGVWVRYRRVARGAGALLIRGRLERSQGVVNIVADRIDPLALLSAESAKSRDFR